MADLVRPQNDEYYVGPWSDIFLQGDVLMGVPLGFPIPPDAELELEGSRHFLSGPFEAGLAMLITPSCAMAAQGKGAAPGGYALPGRTLVPVRPLEELEEKGAITSANVGNLRADRLRNYFYVPADTELGIPEAAALLYEPITLHHDLIRDQRLAQLTGAA